jgi:hypothetical protein
MTPEQFIFWLSGYFTAGKDNDDDITVNDIREALKTVKVSVNTVMYFGGENS